LPTYGGSHTENTIASLRQRLYAASIGLDIRMGKQEENPPPFLHHYTDANGLLGILETSTIFATNYRRLNDSSEIQHKCRVRRRRYLKTL
jgi:hypothetical protein